MLVDNGVNGDSRVQKAASSAADHGWDVLLLGRSPDDRPHSWRLGQAEVRLLPMPDPLNRRRHEFRRAWLRWPLAYPPNGIAPHRAQWVKAWQADLRVRAAQLTLAEADPAGHGLSRRAIRLRRLALRARTLSATMLRRWVSLRYWMLTRARKGRKLTGPWDRAYTMFWTALLGDGAWRRLEPGLWDYELAYGDVIDKFAPDLIHANDFRMLGVGARATLRARAAGRPVRLVWDAHEFLPGLKPWRDNARWLPAMCAHEREYAPYADAVVTVSDGLADLLRERHKLAEQPVVVLNAPDVTVTGTGTGVAGTGTGVAGAVAATGTTVAGAVVTVTGTATAGAGAGDDPAAESGGALPDVGLRELCGIGPDVPLLVYSGAAAKQRGLDIMVEALPQLEGVHVALVVNKPTGGYVQGLLSRAAELGVGDRVHAVPYVPHWQVVAFLSAADAGVIPIHHWPNHEIALITKFFEYSHARLPLIVSDVKTMSKTVRETGQGEVFRAEDVADYLRAVRLVLADRERYRAAYDRPGLLDRWTWRAQADILDGVYRRLFAEATGRQAATSAQATAGDPGSGVAAGPGTAGPGASAGEGLFERSGARP